MQQRRGQQPLNAASSKASPPGTTNILLLAMLSRRRRGYHRKWSAIPQAKSSGDMKVSGGATVARQRFAKSSRCAQQGHPWTRHGVNMAFTPDKRARIDSGGRGSGRIPNRREIAVFRRWRPHRSLSSSVKMRLKGRGMGRAPVEAGAGERETWSQTIRRRLFLGNIQSGASVSKVMRAT